jgi:hypothetical protein
MELFKDRILVVATKHQKEKVIGPIFSKELQVNYLLDEELNTDLLGTFTGEVERTLDPIAAAKRKCEMAMDHIDCDLAVASEGSFTAHPAIPFLSVNEEYLLFVDRKNDIQIQVREITYETNFCAADITSEQHLLHFANLAKFPSHALIMRSSKEDHSEIVKGIQDVTQLTSSFHHFMSHYGSCYVETDMRALYNPTRMAAIEKLTRKLVKKIASYCPMCQKPGFDVKDVIKGLPCSECGMPTRSTLIHIYQCEHCNHSKEHAYPHGHEFESPQYCDRCNP